MDFERLQRIYEDQFIDRAWWGHFNISGAPVNKSFHTVNIVGIVAACAKLALHITGEIPRIVLSNKAPNLSVNPAKIALNIKILRLDIPEDIKVNALFGSFIHELGHLLYTREDIGAREARRYTPVQTGFLHMLEDRRVESKLVNAYPGYHSFLYTARHLTLSMGWWAMEQRIGFYGGMDPENRDINGNDGHEALTDYICCKILYPNILEDPVYIREVNSFPGNSRKVKEIDLLLDKIKGYAALTFTEIESVAEELAGIVGENGTVSENFCLQEVKNTLRQFEDYTADRDIRMAESVIADMQRTFNPEKFHYYAKTFSSESNRRTQASAREFVHVIREVEAEAGTISGELLKKARELAAGIQLQLSMFSAKTDKNKVIYEQDAGELDEEELYQSRYNRNIFWEETPAPSARLEVVILLDLSGPMVTGDKIAMQTVLAVALVLAFERYANVVTYSVYGHRCDDNGIEVTCFHKPGRRLQLAKLFSQKALYANADGYAMQYCFEKFQPDSPHKLFLMISDGTPSVVASEGEDPQEQVREVVHEGKKKRIEVLSLGIDNYDQADMYDVFIPYSGADTIVLFSRWLRKKFSSLADETVF